MHERTTGPQARDARRLLIQAQAAAADAALAYAEARRRQDSADPVHGKDGSDAVGARPGEFAADELAVMWCDNPWQVRRLLARCGRVRSGLPTVWEAHHRGEVDADQLQVIDRAARRAAEDAPGSRSMPASWRRPAPATPSSSPPGCCGWWSSASLSSSRPGTAGRSASAA